MVQPLWKGIQQYWAEEQKRLPSDRLFQRHIPCAIRDVILHEVIHRGMVFKSRLLETTQIPTVGVLVTHTTPHLHNGIHTSMKRMSSMSLMSPSGKIM